MSTVLAFVLLGAAYASAEAGYFGGDGRSFVSYGGYGGYGGYRGYHGYGKRSADAEAEADAEPGYLSRGYGGYGGYGRSYGGYGGYGLSYGGYGGYHGYHGYGKRSADAEAEAEPGYLSRGY